MNQTPMMRALEVQALAPDFAGLALTERSMPQAGPGQRLCGSKPQRWAFPIS